MNIATRHVRFTPECGHVWCISRRPLRARSGHCSIYSITSSTTFSGPNGTVGASDYCFLNGLFSGVPQKYDKLGSLIVVHDLPGLVAQNGNGQFSAVAVGFFFSFASACGTPTKKTPVATPMVNALINFDFIFSPVNSVHAVVVKLEADMCSAAAHVCFGPKADIVIQSLHRHAKEKPPESIVR